mmetsp:Transcript_16866/g.45691  ORF Transcript_16866/g.45691 Transcript_16866/m.45691 type:complete len:360 (-) Transcript_16866:7-1086(-)
MHEMLASPRPLHRTRTECRMPDVKQVPHGRQLGAHLCELHQGTLKIALRSKEGRLESRKEKGPRVLLRGPNYDALCLLMTTLPCLQELSQKGADIDGEADQEHCSEGRLDALLLPAHAQLLESLLSSTRKSRGPSRCFHHCRRKKGGQEVEHAQRKEARGPHRISLVPIKIKTLSLQVSQERPRPKNLPDTAWDRSLHHLHKTTEQEGETAENSFSGPISILRQELVCDADLGGHCIQLVVLKGGQPVDKAHQGRHKREVSARIVFAPCEHDRSLIHQLRSLLQGVFCFLKLAVQHQTDRFAHGKHVLIPPRKHHGVDLRSVGLVFWSLLTSRWQVGRSTELRIHESTEKCAPRLEKKS